MLSPAARRAAAAADADVAAGRYESALDASLLLSALAPDYLPAFARQAELLVALGRAEEALTLVETISTLATLRGDSRYDIDLCRIAAHAEPTVERVLDLVDTLVTARRADLLATYAPVAIDLLLAHGQPARAEDVARAWFDVDRTNWAVCYALVRELLRAAKFEEAASVLEETAEPRQASPHWFAARLAAARANRAD
ncbi:MAG: hypothetical protein IRY97_06115, partial [Thermomicrobiaceae bacterium]|nr:hypothetical protein [Thermomicrobiaceae bacterium]